MTQVGHARETRDNTTAPLISGEAADGLKSAVQGEAARCLLHVLIYSKPGVKMAACREHM